MYPFLRREFILKSFYVFQLKVYPTFIKLILGFFLFLFQYSMMLLNCNSSVKNIHISSMYRVYRAFRKFRFCKKSMIVLKC